MRRNRSTIDTLISHNITRTLLYLHIVGKYFSCFLHLQMCGREFDRDTINNNIVRDPCEKKICTYYRYHYFNFFSLPDGKRQAISIRASWHRFENTLLLALRYGSYMMHILVYTTHDDDDDDDGDRRTSFSIFDVACRDGGNEKRWPCDYQFSHSLSHTLCTQYYTYYSITTSMDRTLT